MTKKKEEKEEEFDLFDIISKQDKKTKKKEVKEEETEETEEDEEDEEIEETEEEELIEKEAKEEVKEKPKEKKKTISKSKKHKKPVRGKIILINGYEGTGKSTTASTFEAPFFICLERGKFMDLIDYPPEIVPEFGDFIEAKYENKKYIEGDYIIANVMDKKGEEDKEKTYDNILKWVEWFKTQNKKKSLIIDTAKALWDTAWGKEEQKKGRPLGKVEYIPITTELKKWVFEFMHWCRDNGRNFILTSHTTGKYKDIDQYTTLQTGEEPDAKYWIREAVSWRIDLLKPETSGYDNRFIAFFSKAPGKQYFYLDITNKRLGDILDDPERLKNEIQEFEDWLDEEKGLVED